MSLSCPLTPQQIDVVKSTIPLLESAGSSITEHFYKRMFSHNPEVQHIFNMSNQHSGKQPFALFSAIAAYAHHIDNLPALTQAVDRIANKHASLNVKPEHYPIVGHHLIETLKELAPDQFTKTAEEAWIIAYQFLADIFIDQEETIYQHNADAKGGWRDVREFRLIEKRIESELVKSLVFEPVDKNTVVDYKPGQYIGVQVSLPEQEYKETRQYSLSDQPNGEHYRISVKREIVGTPGAVSNYLHDGLRLGDTVNISAPTGDFFYKDKQAPVVLISAGVGITPMLAITETLVAKQSKNPIYFLHACENLEQHSFKKRIESLSQQTALSYHTWYRNDHPEDAHSHHGYMDLSQIENELPLADGEFYLCGPVPFMQFAKQQLLTLAIPEDRIHYEVFGPHEAF